MKHKQIAAMMNAQLVQKGWTVYRLQARLKGRIAPQTVANALSGNVIKSDTLLALLDELGLEITVTAKDGQ